MQKATPQRQSTCDAPKARKPATQRVRRALSDQGFVDVEGRIIHGRRRVSSMLQLLASQRYKTPNASHYVLSPRTKRSGEYSHVSHSATVVFLTDLTNPTLRSRQSTAPRRWYRHARATAETISSALCSANLSIRGAECHDIFAVSQSLWRVLHRL
jgi:hypothetical protein